MIMKECSACFASVEESQNICPYCGASMKNSKYITSQNTNECTQIAPEKNAKKECSNCFATVDADKKACPHCGASMEKYKPITNLKSKYTSMCKSAGNKKAVNVTSVSPFFTGSFWLGFSLGLLGLLIVALGFQNPTSTKNAIRGVLFSIILTVVISVIITIAAFSALVGM